MFVDFKVNFAGKDVSVYRASKEDDIDGQFFWRPLVYHYTLDSNDIEGFSPSGFDLRQLAKSTGLHNCGQRGCCCLTGYYLAGIGAQADMPTAEAIVLRALEMGLLTPIEEKLNEAEYEEYLSCDKD